LTIRRFRAFCASGGIAGSAAAEAYCGDKTSLDPFPKTQMFPDNVRSVVLNRASFKPPQMWIMILPQIGENDNGGTHN
jgi:hypothetical protein